MHILLEDKVAVVYGGSGAIGGAVARAFAEAGATVHAPTRAEVDALDEAAIERHLQAVGPVDVSVNAIGLPNADMLGVPLREIEVERFLAPIAAYTRSFLLTARAAARHGASVILTVSALPARVGSPLNGGYGPAQAAKEALVRDLSLELAPVRVLALRPHGVPETPTMREIYALKARDRMTWEQFEAALVSGTHPRRGTTLAELADAAVLVASDRARGLTATTVNLTLGAVAD